MRGYDRADLYGRLLDLLDKKGGMTGSAISDELDVSRITMSKYLAEFASDGMVHSKNVGSSVMWYAGKSAVRLDFPADYARAGQMYTDAVKALSEGEADSVLGSCMNCGASAAGVLSEVVSPAINDVSEMYKSGKIGRAEESLMNSIISGSTRRLAGPGTGDGSTRRAILLAADPQSALYADATASVLGHGGWRAMRLGDMSHAVGVMLDTEIKKLLVRIGNPNEGIAVMIIFSSTLDGLRAFGAAANAARRGAASGTLLALCGPKGDDVESDAWVQKAEDIVHWADSM